LEGAQGAVPAWLQHVTHRSDLTYLLTELISELSIGHTYVEGGDYLLPERAKVGLPGRAWNSTSRGRYRIAKIYAGQMRSRNTVRPHRSGRGRAGRDYVLAIDSVELKSTEDPYKLLRNKTFSVTLT